MLNPKIQEILGQIKELKKQDIDHQMKQLTATQERVQSELQNLQKQITQQQQQQQQQQDPTAEISIPIEISTALRDFTILRLILEIEALTLNPTNKLEVLDINLAELREYKDEIRTRIQNGLQSTELTREAIAQRIQELATAIIADKTINNPLLICVLNGAMPFVVALSTELAKRSYPHQLDILGAKSYDGTISGKLRFTAEPKLKKELYQRNIIICEDVCDTGKTALATKMFFLKQSKVVKFVSLVDKCYNRPENEPRVPGGNPDFSGFQIDATAFIVGFGLDYNEWYRELLNISNVDPTTLENEPEATLLALEQSIIEQCQLLLQVAEENQQKERRPSITGTRHNFHRRNGSIGIISVNAPIPAEEATIESPSATLSDDVVPAPEDFQDPENSNLLTV